MSAPDDLIAGRYRLVRLVGKGGMGSVWEAMDERLHRPVALKQLHAQLGLSPEETELANQRAMREARITARLHHRHAVPVFDVVEHQGRPCLIMQFLPSMALSAVLRESGPLHQEETAQVGAQISSALAAAHAVGIVHRDVKPGNILIGDDGAALITDFGISHAMGDTTLTATGLVHGTPAFLAPEVARGSESTFASDVFSLGSTLYAALEGAPPFGTDSNSIALLHRVAAGEFSPPPHGGPVTPVLLDMLSLDPQARPTMKAAAETLRGLTARGATPAAELSLTPTRPMEPVGAPVSPAPPAPPPSPAVISAPAPSAESSAPDALQSPAAPATIPNARPQPADPPEPGRRKSRPVIWAAAVLAVVLVAVAAWWLSRDPGSLVAEQGPNSSASTAAASETPTTAAASPTTSPTTSPTSTPGTQPTSEPKTPTAAQLAGTITDYYALVPDDTDRSWSMLTPSYQKSPSGGRKAYENFWAAVDRVSVSGVTGKPPDKAEATVTYVYKDGRVVRERTAFGLVDDDGTLKINSSSVLSSSTR